MKIHLVTFGNDEWLKRNFSSFDRLSSSALKFDVNEIHFYNQNTLPINKELLEEFKKTNVGFGFYAWKPIIILDTFSKIDFGDFVIYHDCGRLEYKYEFKKSVIPLLETLANINKGIGVAQSFWKHKEFCKRQCFEVMGCNTSEYIDSWQLNASWNIWQKNDYAFSVLKEWETWNLHESKIITNDNINKSTELPNFNSHRWDQSILTNIIKNRELLKEITSFPPRNVWEKDINNYL